MRCEIVWKWQAIGRALPKNRDVFSIKCLKEGHGMKKAATMLSDNRTENIAIIQSAINLNVQ
jgi:hypothetical protein